MYFLLAMVIGKWEQIFVGIMVVSGIGKMDVTPYNADLYVYSVIEVFSDIISESKF